MGRKFFPSGYKKEQTCYLQGLVFFVLLCFRAYAQSSEVPVSNDQQAPLRDMTGEVSPDPDLYSQEFSQSTIPDSHNSLENSVVDTGKLTRYTRDSATIHHHTPPKFITSPPTTPSIFNKHPFIRRPPSPARV